MDKKEIDVLLVSYDNVSNDKPVLIVGRKGKRGVPQIINAFQDEEADLIVAVPKDVALTANGDSKYILEFGESTSYEMAIARRFNKPILFG